MEYGNLSKKDSYLPAILIFIRPTLSSLYCITFYPHVVPNINSRYKTKCLTGGPGGPGFPGEPSLP